MDEAEQLALPKHIRITLPVVGSGARPKEVSFVIAADFRFANFGIDEESETRLPRGEIHFREFAKGIGVVRNTRKRCVDISACCCSTVHGRRFNKSAGGYVYALV